MGGGGGLYRGTYPYCFNMGVPPGDWSLAYLGTTGVFLLLQIFSDDVWLPGLSIPRQLIISVSPRS